jgi:hypothetical protein
MKAISIREAEGQLGQLVAEACRGETIVLTDGDNEVTLSPRPFLDLEEDSPELEAELLKAVNGPHAPYSSEEMRAACEKVIREKRTADKFLC